jgi:tricorn protease-like protein
VHLKKKLIFKKTNKNMFYLVRYFCMDIDFVVPSIEGDRIIPLYTNSLTLQRQSPK